MEEVEELEARVRDTEARIAEMGSKLVDLYKTERVTPIKHPT